MERAGTVQGSERFDDYVDLVALKGLHALKATVKAYEQDNMSDQLGVANSIVMDMPAAFTALQKQNQFNRDAWPYVAMMYPNMLFPITYRKHGANANNVKPKDIKEQKFIQDLAEQNRMTPEEEIQLQQHLQQLSSGEALADEVGQKKVNSQQVPETQGESEYYAREPLTYEDKREVMGGNSDLAGDPYTMGHITTAGLNFVFDDIGTIVDPNAAVAEKMMAGVTFLGKPIKAVDRIYDAHKDMQKVNDVRKATSSTNNNDKFLTKNGAFRDAKRKAGIPNSSQHKKPVYIYDATSENRWVYEFEVNGKKKYLIRHDDDKFGRGPHFHGADDLKGSPLEKGRYNQYPGHHPEDFEGYKK